MRRIVLCILLTVDVALICVAFRVFSPFASALFRGVPRPYAVEVGSATHGKIEGTITFPEGANIYLTLVCSEDVGRSAGGMVTVEALGQAVEVGRFDNLSELPVYRVLWHSRATARILPIRGAKSCGAIDSVFKSGQRYKFRCIFNGDPPADVRMWLFFESREHPSGSLVPPS